MNWMNGIIIIFFRQKKKQDASVSLIGNTCERRRRRKKTRRWWCWQGKKRHGFDYCYLRIYYKRTKRFIWSENQGWVLRKDASCVRSRTLCFFFFLFFHALSLLQLLTMFQRWATLCVNVAGVSNNLNTRFERACRYFFFFFLRLFKKTSRVDNLELRWQKMKLESIIINWTNYNCR